MMDKPLKYISNNHHPQTVVYANSIEQPCKIMYTIFDREHIVF